MSPAVTPHPSVDPCPNFGTILARQRLASISALDGDEVDSRHRPPIGPARRVDYPLLVPAGDTQHVLARLDR